MMARTRVYEAASYDLKHLEMEFFKLCQASIKEETKETLSPSAVLEWSEVQALVADELLTTDDMMSILDEHTAPDGSIRLPDFININNAIDHLLDIHEPEEEDLLLEQDCDDFEVLEGGSGFGRDKSVGTP